MNISQNIFKKIFTSLLAPFFNLAFGKDTFDDEVFINDSVALCNIEIHVSKLALQGSIEKPIRDFSNTMVVEYSTLLSELLTILNSHNFESYNRKKFTAIEDRIVDDLNSASFNKTYLSIQIELHEKIIELFHSASTSADTEIATFALRVLPKLARHLNMAQRL